MILSICIPDVEGRLEERQKTLPQIVASFGV